jgi:hypothetical protein
MFDNNGTFKWGRYWGSTKTEAATGIALDDAQSSFFVSGYSSSLGTLSIGGFDMILVKFVVSTGLVAWARRYGFNNNDYANGVFATGGFVYLAG